MYQFFADQALVVGSVYPMDKPTAHHIFKVLRLKVHQEVILVSSQHQKFQARLEADAFVVVQKLEINNELAVDVTLILAVASKEVLEFSLQKGCELGVKCLVVVETRYSPVKVKEPEKKLGRWREIVKAAAMQSKRNLIPEVVLVQFSELPNYASELSLVADELAPHDQLISRYCRPDVSQVTFMVGSEGGFHRQEIAQLQEWGYQPVSLTKTILRAETAVMFGLISLVNYFNKG